MLSRHHSLRNKAPIVNDEDSSAGTDDFVDHPLPKKVGYDKNSKKVCFFMAHVHSVICLVFQKKFDLVHNLLLF